MASFDVLRDGYPLAVVNATTLIDSSIYVNQTYCYHVKGYDPRGYLIAATRYWMRHDGAVNMF